jgi:hypothetical protein
MGLLDDAIREHLELKRRRGADATEVARQEQEAFGPPRRGDVEGATATATATAEPAHDDHDAAEEQTVLHVVPQPEPVPHNEEHPVQDEPSRFHGDPADDLPHLEPAHERPHPEPEPHNDEHPVQDEPPRFHGDPADDLPHLEQVAEPAPEPEPEPTAPAPRADEQEAEPEDVLEETPEFLQETPEHDRLWFEQRPPRDFDF